MHDDQVATNNESIHVVLAGGGSAGHVYPALAIAAELAERGHAVSWVGRTSSMEERLVVASGVPFHGLPAKPWLGKSPVAKLAAVGTLLTSSVRARSLLGRVGADVVLGTGGYVAAPAVVAARFTGRPAFLLEPNVVAGAANRFVSRWCRAAFVAHEETGRRLACEAVVSGIPVRRDFYEIGALPAGSPRVLVLGGSQGARQINELLPRVVRRLESEGHGDFAVVHQTGGTHFETVSEDYRKLGVETGRVEIVPFIEDVAAEMARAHLVISRAGAVSTAELGAAGRPQVLIPLTSAGAGHQRFNAERMERAGAARVLADAQVTTDRLFEVLAELLGDRAQLEAMATAARKQATSSAAAEIAQALERAGRPS